MSRHVEKYPGLYSGARKAGVNYMTALARVKKGCTVEQALSLETREYRRKRSLLVKPTPMMPWERPGYRTVGPVKARMRHPSNLVDVAPRNIQELRAAYCNNFIKTGDFDPTMLAQLKVYAHACRTSQKNSQRVPTEKRFAMPVAEMMCNLMTVPPSDHVAFFGETSFILRERVKLPDEAAPPYKQEWLELDVRPE